MGKGEPRKAQGIEGGAKAGPHEGLGAHRHPLLRLVTQILSPHCTSTKVHHRPAGHATSKNGINMV